MGLLSGIQRFLSFFGSDIETVMDNLRCDSVAARASASGWLQNLAEEGQVPRELIPEIIKALHREDERRTTTTALLSTLSLLGTDDAKKGLNSFYCRLARDIIKKRDDPAQLALFALEDSVQYLIQGTAGFHAVRLGLLRVVVDNGDTSGRRLRCFNLLKAIDEPLLDILKEEERKQLEMAAQLLTASIKIFKVSTRLLAKKIIINISNDIIDVTISESLMTVVKMFRDALIEKTGKKHIRYVEVEISTGNKIRLPDVEDIPDTAFFKLIDGVIDAIVNPYNQLPPSLRPS